ncbi:MAG: VOC family protein [Maricaulaceae bacterium]
MDDIFGPITQLGFLTDNIEETAEAWTKTRGVGPWTKMPNVTMEAVMDGAPVQLNIDVALTYQGDVQIELIRPICDSPSPYLANKIAGIWGAHHIQYETDDMAKSLEIARDAGLELACTIEQGDSIYTYLRGPMGWTELMQAGSGVKALFQMIKAKSVGWDGKETISDFGL